MNNSAVVFVCLCILVGSLAVATPVSSSDRPSFFYLEEDEYEVNTGETVAVDVMFFNEGGYHENGVESFEFVLEVNPDVADIVEVERGPWMGESDDDVEYTVTAIDDGAVLIQQERTVNDGGAVGNDVAATVHISILDDAPEGISTITIPHEDADARLVDSDFPIYTSGTTSELVIGDGDTDLDPDDGNTSDDTGLSVITGDDRTVDEPSDDMETDDIEDDDPLAVDRIWLTGSIVVVALLSARSRLSRS